MCLVKYYDMNIYWRVEVYFYMFLIWQHWFVSRAVRVEFMGEKVVRKPVSLRVFRSSGVSYHTTNALY